MKVFIICSKKFYDKITPIQAELEKAGHIILLPSCFDDPGSEERYRDLGPKEHSEWKATILKHSTNVINTIDAVLVLNFEKNGMENYIGGATFLEMYDAFRLDKKIYLYNNVPEGILHDEVRGFEPILIQGDISKIV